VINEVTNFSLSILNAKENLPKSLHFYHFQYLINE